MAVATKNDIDTLSDNLGGKIDTLSDTLGGKIDALNDTLGGKIDALSDKIDKLTAAINRKTELTVDTEEITEDAPSAVKEWTKEDNEFINASFSAFKGHPDTRRYLVNIKNGIQRRLFAAALLVMTTVLFFAFGTAEFVNENEKLGGHLIAVAVSLTSLVAMVVNPILYAWKELLQVSFILEKFDMDDSGAFREAKLNSRTKEECRDRLMEKHRQFVVNVYDARRKVYGM